MVSLPVYAGLRDPEELLAVEVRHLGRRTLLVEQRNIAMGRSSAGRGWAAFIRARLIWWSRSGVRWASLCSPWGSGRGCRSLVARRPVALA
jgi:hypothetical protein